MKRRYPFRRARRYTKRRRTARRRAFRTRKNVKPKVVMKRTSYIGAWTFGTATTNDFWRYRTYNANQHFTNFTEISSLFDEYKINRIKITFRPRYNDVPIGGQPEAYAHVIVDPESKVTPSGTYTQATVNAFLENGNVRTFNLARAFSVYFRPKVLMSTPTGTVATFPKYMNTTDNTVVHSGFHMFLMQNNMLTTNTNIILDEFVTIYMSARNPK